MESNFPLERLLESGKDYLYVLEGEGELRPIYIGSGILELFGDGEELRREGWWKRLLPEDESALRKELRELGEGARTSKVYRIRKGGGGYLWIKDEVQRVELGGRRFFVGRITDVTNLCHDKRRFEVILNFVHDVIAIVDKDGIIRFKSPSVEKLLGWKPEEVLGRHFSEFVHPSDLYGLEEMKGLVFGNPGKTFRAEYRIKNKAGGWQWVEGLFYLPPDWESLGIEGAIVTEKDITERKRAEHQLLKITFYDPLTGLPNRLLFLEKLKELLNIAKRKEELLAVVVLDIRGLGEINSTFGHHQGDRILREVAYRLRTSFRASDLVSRFLADEFGLIFTGLKNRRTLYFLLEKIEKLFRRPFSLNGTEIYLRINMGVSFFPIDGIDAEELVRKAEMALLESKRAGEGVISFFSKKLDQERVEANIIRHTLREALLRKEFLVYYQPIHGVNGRVVGLEALVRWQHPRLGLLPPIKFIPVAEETGDILEIGYYVLETALKDLLYLKNQGLNGLYVAVNFSTKQFLARDLLYKVEAFLSTYGVAPGELVVEITESTAMKDPRKTHRILRRFKELGAKIAIDDFGNGYSSLDYLVRFDIDKIKVEKTFVKDMASNPKVESVVRTIIDLSHSLGASALAEGVESASHKEKLVEMGCDELQGFFFSPPVTLAEVTNYIKRHIGRNEGTH